MPSFDEIFGPGEFDEEENSYRRVFPGFEAGGTQNVLDFATLLEHSRRHGHSLELFPNGNSKDLEIENGDITVEVENYPDGRTELGVEVEKDVEDLESYLEKPLDQWLGEIIRREQKIYRASTDFVYRILPEKAAEENIDEIEALERELDGIGGHMADFHSAYRNRSPVGMTARYGMEFELWPFESFDMDRSKLPGKMPYGDELDDSNLISRNDLYMKRYLQSLVEMALDEYGRNRGLEHMWLEYVDSGFEQAKV